MGRFTDIFIRRPVLAVVISLLIAVLGFKALFELPVRQFPKVDSALITISTSYPGAPADLVEGFITRQIERSVSNAEGVDYIESSSTTGSSDITVHLKLNFDLNVAFTDIMSKVAQVKNVLPEGAQSPIIQKKANTPTSILFMAFDSTVMSQEQMTDYIIRAVLPKLDTIDGVSSASVMGGKNFAMRIWLDPLKMAAHHVTTSDVNQALLSNNFQSAAGNVKGQFIEVSLATATGVHDVDSFRRLVVRSDQDQLVYLSDVASVTLSSSSFDQAVLLNGKQAVFVAVNGAPDANPLSVIQRVRSALPQIQQSYPPTLQSHVVYDATLYVKASMIEVFKTLCEALVIVMLVMYLFLGAFRAVVIPLVAIPLSLVGVLFVMWQLGYSINVLTLLAMVLAIGLVVDDAIVVVENVDRHIHSGLSAAKAALIGAREIAAPVVAMTITLFAVYFPIGFMQGLTGTLFKEFAFTLAGAVIISGVVALTLSPMMCANSLSSTASATKVSQFSFRIFSTLQSFYGRILRVLVTEKRGLLCFLAAVLVSSCVFYLKTPAQLAPPEDQGFLFIGGMGPDDANSAYMNANAQYMADLLQKNAGVENAFVVVGMNAVQGIFGGALLKPWSDRASVFAIKSPMTDAMNTVPGLRLYVSNLPALPGSGGGLPLQFVVTTVGSYAGLYRALEPMVKAANKSGLFLYVNSDLKFTKPVIKVDIDRGMAASLSVSMQSIGSAMEAAFGGNLLNWFTMYGSSYPVIPQFKQWYRLNPQAVDSVYVSSAKGSMVPLSSFVRTSTTVEPSSLSHFQQLNAATIGAVLAPDVTIGQAVEYFTKAAQRFLPTTMSYTFTGQARQYAQEGSAMMVTFFMSLLIIYLVLSVQFNSFRDPLIVLVSVPLSIFGALFCLNIGSFISPALTINIYTQIGLITLMGLISKHGILIVQFAHQLQRQKGLSPEQAGLAAAQARLRPILMTTVAMVAGIMPLLFASGAGAQSRFAIAAVVVVGLLVGTAFTLFIVPCIYAWYAKIHANEAPIDV